MRSRVENFVPFLLIGIVFYRWFDAALKAGSKASPKEPWTVWSLDQITTFRRIAGPMMVELGYPDE